MGRIMVNQSFSPPRITSTSTSPLGGEGGGRSTGKNFTKLKITFPGRNTPIRNIKGSETLGKLSSRNKNIPDLKVGKSLAVDRTKFSMSELQSHQSPKVALNNFYTQSKMPSSLKFA